MEGVEMTGTGRLGYRAGGAGRVEGWVTEPELGQVVRGGQHLNDRSDVTTSVQRSRELGQTGGAKAT